MKRLLITSGVFLLAAVFLVLLFRVVDASLELDDLKSGIDLRHKEISMLIVITNAALDNCALTTDKLEYAAKGSEGAPPVQWIDDLLLFGNWRFTKKGKCVVKVELINPM